MTAPNQDFDEIPQIVFGRDWSQAVRGQLQPGRAFHLSYDSARLPEVRDTYNGLPTWSIVAFAQFHPPDGPVTKKALEFHHGEVMGQTFDIPPDADELVLWFSNSGRSGRVFYDSDYGRNYRFRFPGHDIRLVSARFSAEGDDEYGGLSVAVSTPPTVCNVGLEYSISTDQGPYPSKGCICLEVTGEENRRKQWSISEYMVPARRGLEFSISYQIGGHRFRDDNGGRGYEAMTVSRV